MTSGEKTRLLSACALKESEERLGTIFEKSPLGIALMDFGGRVLDVNPALLKMLGYSKEDLLGNHFSDFTHPDDIERQTKVFLGMKEEKNEVLRLENRYVRKDGQLVWGSLSANLWNDPTGGRFLIGMVENITDRKRAEERL